MSLDLGVLTLRIVIGGIFTGYGMQKLAGWFGDPGLRGFTGMLQQSGLRHASAWAMLVALVEVGGLLPATGLLTPLVATGLVTSMLVTSAPVH